MKLLNRYEEITYNRLKSVSAENGAHVFAKVRIADVLPLSGRSVSSELLGFGLKAHFDFIVTSSTYEPLFAVEFDGPLHQQSRIQKQRDEKKNRIVEHFRFPLLRINSRYVDRTYRGLDLLMYFTEVWFLGEAFEKAQSEGYAPYDEPFEPMSIITDGRRKRKWPYWLSLEVQLEIKKMKETNLIRDDLLSYWVGTDEYNNRRCLAWLHITEDCVLVAHTGMRHQHFPIEVSDILQQVSAFDIKRDLDAYLTGKRKTVPIADFETILDEYKKRYRMCCFGGHSKYNEIGKLCF